MKFSTRLLFLLFLFFVCLPKTVRTSPAPALVAVSPTKLCVTEGSIGKGPGDRFSVNVPKMRAFVTVDTTQEIEARFSYLGGTKDEKPLGSGEMRRQFGLKLRAQDACNLIYAMWRIEPEPKLVVSVKSNPGQHGSADCGNRGYRNIKPARSSSVPALREGASHLLRAEMNGEQLQVFADERLVWQGSVGPQASSLVGPVGIRSDNARLEIELRAGQPSGEHLNDQIACRPGLGESE